MSDDDPIPGESIPPGDPRYDGFRLTAVWAWVAVDPEDDQEGICGFRTPTGWLPMIGADEARIRQLRPIAEQLARASERPIQLVKFTTRENLEVIEP